MKKFECFLCVFGMNQFLPYQRNRRQTAQDQSYEEAPVSLQTGVINERINVF